MEMAVKLGKRRKQKVTVLSTITTRASSSMLCELISIVV